MSEETKQFTAEEVRAAFPILIQVAHEYRAVFGNGRLVYVKENGRELGTPSASRGDRVFTVKEKLPKSVPEEQKRVKERKHG